METSLQFDGKQQIQKKKKICISNVKDDYKFIYGLFVSVRRGRE